MDSYNARSTLTTSTWDILNMSTHELIRGAKNELFHLSLASLPRNGKRDERIG